MAEGISVIIPTLNEANYLPAAIRRVLAAAHDRSNLELIVIDSGSSDETVACVKEFPVQVFEKPDFILRKYASLNWGIEKAKGEILIFLDADTLLPYHFDASVIKTLNKKGVVGGAFEFAFAPVNFQLRVIELINRFRYRLDGIYFGDQAIFCKKNVAYQVGGFPKNELMDAAFFCKRLKRVGKLQLIHKKAVTSSRRFTTNGYFRVFWFDFVLWLKFHFVKTTVNEREKYWKFNLGP